MRSAAQRNVGSASEVRIAKEGPSAKVGSA